MKTSEKDSELNIDELRKLSNQIVSDPNSAHDLSPSHAAQLRKYIHPLGTVVSSDQKFANISVTNWHEKYLRRLHTTALVGYLYRTCEEYEPVSELEKENNRYQKACDRCRDSFGEDSNVDLISISTSMNPQSPQITTKSTAKITLESELSRLAVEHEERIKLINSTAKGIITQFLNRNFEYNPDYHLRGSQKAGEVQDAETIRKTCRTVDEKLESKQEPTYKYLRSHLLATYQAAIDSMNAVESALRVTLDTNITHDDKQGILLKKYGLLNGIVRDMKKIVDPIAAAETLHAWEVDPPAELLHQFDRYLINHYEQLKEVVEALYNEKPDIEFAVILYDVHKSAEEAHNYRIQHRDEFRTEVVAVQTGAVNLLGPFKENRDKIEYYNKNTEILRLMQSQIESDHKLGKDLMEKKVRTEKKKNIDEAGPDAPGLAAYSKAHSTVQELGGKKVLTREEQIKLEEAKAEAERIKQDYEVPDDAIQVDVFFPQTNSDGSTEMKKTLFYTGAEADLHMQENSQYTNQYQPKREEGTSLADAYTTKTIVSKKGEKRTIQVPNTVKK